MPEFDPENLVSSKDILGDTLVKYRDLYSNRIPTAILHSNIPDNRFKVRKGWFIGLFQSVEFYTDRRNTALVPALLGEYEDFRADFIRTFSSPTTRDDINRANSFINRVVGVPEETGVPYDRVLAATQHVLDSGDAILRWHGISQDEVASRLPNYHYSHFEDIRLGHARYIPPTDHIGWVIAGYSNAYQAEEATASSVEEKIQTVVKVHTEQWRMNGDGDKRLLILVQTLPSPNIFADPSFPWQNASFRDSVWTVAFDGQFQVTLTKYGLEKSPSSDERKWVSQGVLHF